MPSVGQWAGLWAERGDQSPSEEPLLGYQSLLRPRTVQGPSKHPAPGGLTALQTRSGAPIEAFSAEAPGPAHTPPTVSGTCSLRPAQQPPRPRLGAGAPRPPGLPSPQGVSAGPQLQAGPSPSLLLGGVGRREGMCWEKGNYPLDSQAAEALSPNNVCLFLVQRKRYFEGFSNRAVGGARG